MNVFLISIGTLGIIIAAISYVITKRLIYFWVVIGGFGLVIYFLKTFYFMGTKK